jgi:hypothetical protein
LTSVLILDCGLLTCLVTGITSLFVGSSLGTTVFSMARC